jgi:hypothetical protein
MKPKSKKQPKTELAKAAGAKADNLEGKKAQDGRPS